MRNRNNIFLCACATSLLMTGCVKDELHNTSHPDYGALKVTTDWSVLSTDAVQPNRYVLRIGEITQTVSGTTNTFKELLIQGKQTLLVHNLPNGITVGTHTATVNTLADGTLEPMPEYLFSAVQELNVLKDDTLKVSVKMVQAARNLTLVLSLKPGDAQRIASSKASLTGIAHTVDLLTGALTTPQTGKTVIPAFTKATITRTAEANALTATLKLAGVVAGEKQLFKIVLTLTNGTMATIESDLTEVLKGFNNGNLPFVLNAELLMPKDAAFSGTITDWTEVNNDEVTIH